MCCVQDLRESRSGFLPGCDLEVQGVPFDNAETFYMDPVRPRCATGRAGLAYLKLNVTAHACRDHGAATTNATATEF